VSPLEHNFQVGVFTHRNCKPVTFSVDALLAGLLRLAIALSLFCFVLGSGLARSRWLVSSLGMRCIPILDDDDDDDDSRLWTSAVSRWFCSLLWRALAFSDLGLRLRGAVVTFLLTFSQSVDRSVSQSWCGG